MTLELFFKGKRQIEDFKEMKIEIKLPVKDGDGYRYCNNIEYHILKELRYTIKHIPSNNLLIDSNSNPYGKLCGTTLYMYDEIENKRQVFIEDDIIYFYPYQIYQGCLDHFIKNHNNFNDMELYFKLELNKIQQVTIDTVAPPDHDLYSLMHECMNTDIKINYIF